MSSITLKTWYTLMVIFALATLPQITQAASPCSSGYTLTLYNGYCVCKHGNSIVYPNPACTYTEDKNSCTATCPTGTASRRRRQVPQVLFNDDGSISNCPHGLVSCPISDSPESRHECVNVKSDLYNCGGCAATGKGVVCGDKRGVRAASCDAGQCRIHSCRSGYYLDSHTHTCVHKH